MLQELLLWKILSLDGNGIIVRGFEPYGKEVSVGFGGKLAMRVINRMDILERDLQEKDDKLGPHKIITLRFKK